MTPSEEGPIAAALAGLRGRIAAAAQAAGRDPSTIELVAVSKTFPPERIEEALAAGQRVFGENRVQEAMVKYPSLKSRYAELRLHLIGPLQTNKVPEAVRLFEVIETLDRPRLAEALAIAMEKEGRRPAVFVQVNTGEEPQKSGVLPGDADRLIAEARERWGLPVVGLMCIPPLDEEPSLHFALLREIGRRNGLDRLSMGMSSDYEVAIRFGATELRIGTAIFGARPSTETASPA